MRIEAVLGSVSDGILDFLPDIGRRQLWIEVIRLFNQIAQSHSCFLLGDERSPPRHFAGLRILLLHSVTRLNLLLEVTRLFTFQGAP